MRSLKENSWTTTSYVDEGNVDEKTESAPMCVKLSDPLTTDGDIIYDGYITWLRRMQPMDQTEKLLACIACIREHTNTNSVFKELKAFLGELSTIDIIGRWFGRIILWNQFQSCLLVWTVVTAAVTCNVDIRETFVLAHSSQMGQ